MGREFCVYIQGWQQRFLNLGVAAWIAGFGQPGSARPESEPVISRDGSILRVTWDAGAPGRWQVLGERGVLCASGTYDRGRNTFELSKTPSHENLQIVIGDADRSISRSAPGRVRYSNLPKPSGSSVIYQLPVRTYLAKGMGPEATGRLVDVTTERLREIKELGTDYLWLTGMLEHASPQNANRKIVKGDAGSYYAIHDNWDISPQLGTLNEFSELVERAHSVGLRVLIDLVANHTSRVHRTDVTCKEAIDFGKHDSTDRFFSADNNYYYIQGTQFVPPNQPGLDWDAEVPLEPEIPAKVTGNDIVSATPSITDWYETVKLNYGWELERRFGAYNPRPKTWDQMLDVARYWLAKGVDGFRIDFAHAVPMEFWRFFAAELKQSNPEVFLLAEAYQRDERMKVPGFSYSAFLDAGFDSVYNSDVYWGLRQQAIQSGSVRSANPLYTPSMDRAVVSRGHMFTQYMENHDEVRLASRSFAPWLGDRVARANLGLAYSAYVALLPGHFLIHGGQELQEDASIYGRFAGDNGRTSIFDFTYQALTRQWLYDGRPDWLRSFRDKYRRLLSLKRNEFFSKPHSSSRPTYVDLDGANWNKDQSRWIASYVRYANGKAWLVVLNSDPFSAHKATLHFTTEEWRDSHGILAAMGIENSDKRWRFREVFSREGWTPSDPAVPGEGLPGWVLYRPGNVPSGLHLGDIPPATTMVFEISPVE
jgi:glycosidase